MQRHPTHPERPWNEIYRQQRAFAGGSGRVPSKDSLGRNQVVAQPLADHAGGKYEMSVGCEDSHCQHEKLLKVEELLELRGADATPQDVMWRMRCSRCGRRPGGVRLIWAGSDPSGHWW